MKKLGEITDKEFDQEVVEYSGAVVVYYWADWCPPCNRLSPIMDDIANELSDIKVVKMDFDANPKTAEKLGIESIPTLVHFVQGKEVNRMIGFQPKEQILEFINSN